MDCCENGSKSAVMTVEYSGTKQLNLDMVASHIWGGGQVLEGNRREGEGDLKVKMKSSELPYPSSIAWSLSGRVV